MGATIPAKVVIATRGSPLALWQSNWVASRLAEIHSGLGIELHVVRTTGDRFQEAALQAIGGKGAFTKEITEAILRGEADLAVHSLKDLPTEPTPGLRIWAHPERFDPQDAWIGRDGLGYRDLPPGATVATGSLRRRAQVRHHHPTASTLEIRGNVDSRLRKFAEGTMAGMFLAGAGLDRLGLSHHITERLDPHYFLPAPGQGALAVEGRDDRAGEALLRPLDHPETRDRVTAERAFLAELEAGCQVPVAAIAVLSEKELVLDGLVASLDGTEVVRDSARGSREEAERLGRGLAVRLRDRGAGRILEGIRRSGGVAG